MELAIEKRGVLAASPRFSVATSRLTTPYQFVQQSKENWLQYFKRHDISPKSVGVETRFHRHLKYGKNRTYWSEYIFYGYSNFGPGVILLTGFADQPNTQPQHDEYQESTKRIRGGQHASGFPVG